MMQCFLVGYRGIRHLSLVFSSYTHEPTKNTSDAWHILRYPIQKHCITSMYCIVLSCIVLYYIVLYCVVHVLYCIVLCCGLSDRPGL